MSVRISLPAVYRVNDKPSGNLIQQIIEPSYSLDAQIFNYESNKLKGKLIKGESEEILVLQNRTTQSVSFSKVLKAKLSSTESGRPEVDFSTGEWLKHPCLDVKNGVDEKQNLKAILDSWQNAFSYVEENQQNNLRGLRRPQIGAVHAIHSHWTVSEEPATIVMPTGTGKTETMLAILVSSQLRRTLVIVPTDVLRAQLAAKFLTLGVLKEFGVIAPAAMFPVVGILQHKPRTVEELDDFFERCSVIVTTTQIAGTLSDELQLRLPQHCDVLFIDEAHHVAAPTWNGLKERFKHARIVQFTATPFREDDKEVEGKMVFRYPLRKAQEEDYFRPINYKPVLVFRPSEADEKVAAAAVKQLEEDAKYPHIIMARVDSIDKAERVFQIYRKYKQYNPVQLHTGLGAKERKENRAKVLAGESRIVVCVDMLGEGFALPELKIAAFHDIKKSLAVTLQLAGRFTRARSDLGSATFIANIADVRVKHELQKLYRQDTDWNILLPQLGEEINEEQISLREFTEGFSKFPSDIPLRNLRPPLSTVVYKTKCEQWTPEDFFVGIPGIASFERVHWDVNAHKDTLIIVTAQKVPIDWADIRDIYNWDWELLIVFWDRSQNLLFIHSSTNKGEFKKLAEAVAGDGVELIREQIVFRCFEGMNRLRFQNVGLTKQFGRLIRYEGRMGSDVELGLSEVQKKNTRKSVLFGTGYRGGRKVTFGASRKGRMWSFTTANVEALINWCRLVGTKVLDDTIDPDEILKGTLESEIVSERPPVMPVGIDWPEDVYKELETAYSFLIDEDTRAELFETEISLKEPSDTGDITFELTSASLRLEFKLVLFEDDGYKDYRFEMPAVQTAYVKHR